MEICCVAGCVERKLMKLMIVVECLYIVAKG